MIYRPEHLYTGEFSFDMLAKESYLSDQKKRHSMHALIVAGGTPPSKKLLEHINEISVVDFDHTDVVRHPLVSKIVKAYSDQNSDE